MNIAVVAIISSLAVYTSASGLEGLTLKGASGSITTGPLALNGLAGLGLSSALWGAPSIAASTLIAPAASTGTILAPAVAARSLIAPAAAAAGTTIIGPSSVTLKGGAALSAQTTSLAGGIAGLAAPAAVGRSAMVAGPVTGAANIAGPGIGLGSIIGPAAGPTTIIGPSAGATSVIGASSSGTTIIGPSDLVAARPAIAAGPAVIAGPAAVAAPVTTLVGPTSAAVSIVGPTAGATSIVGPTAGLSSLIGPSTLGVAGAALATPAVVAAPAVAAAPTIGALGGVSGLADTSTLGVGRLDLGTLGLRTADIGIGLGAITDIMKTIITNGGGTISLGAGGAIVNGPPTAPVALRGPSGKVAAERLWGPTAAVGKRGW